MKRKKKISERNRKFTEDRIEVVKQNFRSNCVYLVTSAKFEGVGRCKVHMSASESVYRALAHNLRELVELEKFLDGYSPLEGWVNTILLPENK